MQGAVVISYVWGDAGGGTALHDFVRHLLADLNLRVLVLGVASTSEPANLQWRRKVSALATGTWLVSALPGTICETVCAQSFAALPGFANLSHEEKVAFYEGHRLPSHRLSGVGMNPTYHADFSIEWPIMEKALKVGPHSIQMLPASPGDSSMMSVQEAMAALERGINAYTFRNLNHEWL